eukprot:4399069-Prymnesium_polylepis.1
MPAGLCRILPTALVACCLLRAACRAPPLPISSQRTNAARCRLRQSGALRSWPSRARAARSRTPPSPTILTSCRPSLTAREAAATRTHTTGHPTPPDRSARTRITFRLCAADAFTCKPTRTAALHSIRDARNARATGCQPRTL